MAFIRPKFSPIKIGKTTLKVELTRIRFNLTTVGYLLSSFFTERARPETNDSVLLSHGDASPVDIDSTTETLYTTYAPSLEITVAVCLDCDFVKPNRIACTSAASVRIIIS